MSCVTLGKNQNIVHAHNYLLNNQELEHVFEEKDLGVLIDSNLKFDEHIATKVKKANTRRSDPKKLLSS